MHGYMLKITSNRFFFHFGKKCSAFDIHIILNIDFRSLFWKRFVGTEFIVKCFKFGTKKRELPPKMLFGQKFQFQWLRFRFRQQIFWEYLIRYTYCHHANYNLSCLTSLDCTLIWILSCFLLSWRSMGRNRCMVKIKTICKFAQPVVS